MYSNLINYLYTEPSEEVVMSAEGVVHSLQVLEVVTPALHPSLHPELFSLLPLLLSCICSPFTTIRHMAARCVAANTQVDLHHCMLVRLYMWNRKVASLSKLEILLSLGQKKVPMFNENFALECKGYNKYIVERCTQK